MVKKLFKHEFRSYWRILIPVWCVLLGIAVFGRLLFLLESDTVIYDIVSGSSIFFYVLSVIVALVFPLVLAVIRFYKNLFTGEGYLTLTLPVTTGQHIRVKVVTAVTVQLATLLVVLLSAAVFTVGEVLVEVCKAIGYIFSHLAPLTKGHLVFYALEFILLLVVAWFAEFLLYDTCIAIGQLFKKNRVLAAVGVYFGLYMITQVVGTIGVTISAFLDWEAIGELIAKHWIWFVHLVLCGGLVLCAILAVVYYIITHHIVCKRLNLE